MIYNRKAYYGSRFNMQSPKEHGNADLSIDDMIAGMIPDMESALIAGNRQLLPHGIGESGYADCPDCVDWAEHDIRAELLAASVNWIVGKSSRVD